MSEVKLKPCLFCGGEAKMVGDEDGGWIECKKCGARVDFSKSRISQNWNTRKPIESALERLKEEGKLADEEKERCARENHLQFDRAVGYSNGIFNAIEIIKEEVG